MIKAIDIVIIGGGCAGLSLASRLAEDTTFPNRADNMRVLVIEPRVEYVNDKTWCFWSKPKSPLAYKSWSAWNFSDLTDVATHETNNCYYQCIRAIDFYQSAIRLIDKSNEVSLSLNHLVSHITAKKDSFIVHTNKGAIDAKFIIDTRPPKVSDLNQSDLQQSFTGVEIKTQSPIFDPYKVQLMGDMGSDEYGFHFNYILPFSTTHALIEPTRFHLPGLSQKVLDDDLKRCIDQSIGKLPYTVIRKEQGVIPMGFSPPSTGFKNWVLAGTAGGAVRASSGYAFTRIQQWADQCAEAIASNNPLHGQLPDKPIYRNMDALFLKIIKQQPELAQELFMRMAKGVSPETFVRFLSNQANFLDFLKIIKSLPARPFLSQIKNDINHKLKNSSLFASNFK